MEEWKRQQRARARRLNMTISRGESGDAARVDGAEAFALAARMSREQWLLAGNELPSHARADMPVVFIPSGS